MAKQDLAFIGAISHLLKSVTCEASAFLYLPQYIRRHGSDVYLGMSPVQNGGSYLNVLARVGKTGETAANWNNSRQWIRLFQGAKCNNVPKRGLEFA